MQLIKKKGFQKKIDYSVVIQERDLKISLSVLSVVIFLISDMISCLALLSHAKNFHFPIQLHVRTPWNLKKNLNSFVIVNIYLKICKNFIWNSSLSYVESSYTVYNMVRLLFGILTPTLSEEF